VYTIPIRKWQALNQGIVGNEKGSSSTHIYNIPGVRKNKEGVMEITPGLTCFCIAYA
jgi:hypothetical protein